MYAEKNKAWLLTFLILLAIRCYGLTTFAFLEERFWSFTLYLIPLCLLFFLKKDFYGKSISLILLAMIPNMISSKIFNGQSYYDSLLGLIFILHFAFYYLLLYLKPSVQLVEKLVLILASVGFAVYYVQYLILPTSILTTTSGWRLVNADVDLWRFGLIGESILFLSFFLSLQKAIQTKKNKYKILCTIAIVFVILHGYRTMIFALACSTIYYFVSYYGIKKMNKSVLYIGVALCFMYLLFMTGLFDEQLSFMIDKTAQEADDDNNRVICFLFYYKEYLQSPIEWLFGGGFPAGDSNYSDWMGQIKLFGSNVYGRNNWVDIGFIGMSFLGGIVITIIWLWMLFKTILKAPRESLYVKSFCVFILVGTLTLPIGINDESIIIQCIGFYIASRTNYLKIGEHKV